MTFYAIGSGSGSIRSDKSDPEEVVAKYTKDKGTGPRRLHRYAFAGESSASIKDDPDVIYTIPGDNNEKYEGMSRPDAPQKKSNEMIEIELELPELPKSSGSSSSSKSGGSAIDTTSEQRL